MKVYIDSLPWEYTVIFGFLFRGEMVGTILVLGLVIGRNRSTCGEDF